MASNILYPSFNLQNVIKEPILESEYLDPGYTGHATDVWRVRTEKRTVALRIFNSGVWSGPFWSGMRWLFHWRYGFGKKVAARNRFLQQTGGLPVPKALSNGDSQGLEYLVMEWMPGKRMESFAELSPAGLHAFGHHLAAMHTYTFPKSGTVDGSKGWAPQYFHGQVIATLGMLFGNFYKDKPEFVRIHEDMLRRARELRVERFSPVLVDLSASQYLRNEQDELCALVDTDAYVSGPRELDFVILEYGLTPALAKHFIRGYEELLPLPKLREVRPLYRYLYRMMEVEGAVPLKEWMARPELFK